MTERLFTPPHDLSISDRTPLTFLAGPVQGAPDWQNPLAHQLLEARTGIAIASPRRSPVDQLAFDANEQVAWELRTRERTRKFGVTAFWWAAQDLTDDSYPVGRAYAQTSRIEFGEAIGWLHYEPDLPLVVGFDPEYTNAGGGSEGYMRKVLKHYGVKVCDSIDELAEEILNKMPDHKDL